MKSFKKGCRLALVASVSAASLALSLVGTTAANANEAKSADASAISASDESWLRNEFTRFDVPAAQQDALIAAAEAGQPFDVFRPGATPVSTQSDVVKGNFTYDIKRYADGSYSAVGLEIPQAAPNLGTVSPMSISQCHFTNGSGYSNASGCQVDATWAGTIFIGAANVSYTIVNAGYDQITGTGYGFQSCHFPTSCGSPTRVLYKSAENASGPAYARWQSDVSAAWGTWNVWVQLNVGGNSANQTNS